MKPLLALGFAENRATGTARAITTGVSSQAPDRHDDRQATDQDIDSNFDSKAVARASDPTPRGDG